MNIFCAKILSLIADNEVISQRELSSKSGFSLGVVNKSIHSLIEEGFLTEANKISEKGNSVILKSKPRNAIILAAGYGLRMVPINTELPKGLLCVDGIPLIERIIEQLHEVGVFDIQIVVGYLKEKFEYLIDKYNVKLVCNSMYSEKNNLHSLFCVKNDISDTYIIPSDLWCAKNPFNKSEFFSWYMIGESVDQDSTVRVNRRLELENIKKNEIGNVMMGISYITAADSILLIKKIEDFCANKKYDNSFWECALFSSGITVNAQTVKSGDVVEINSYEQLRELDSCSKSLENESISIISSILNCPSSEIYDIQTLKKGMTNRSYIFSVGSKRYIMRIPGEGTDCLINRKQEAEVYNVIKGKNICDELFYINPDNGFKISSYIANSRVCNPNDENDLIECMKKLKSFHGMKLKVEHEFNLFEQIEYYQSLWNGQSSIFSDYQETKKHIYELIPFIEENKTDYVLTHIDAVCDNFLFSKNENNDEIVQLIDWEYAGMQDPHVDLAMFSIYAFYEKNQIDKLIDIYFENCCDRKTRVKIYCYVAVCGLLWSNWCDYKRQLGVEFGEYHLRQYRYAKDFYKIAIEEIKNIKLDK